jgi:uncharacterized protein (DUF433 family)
MNATKLITVDPDILGDTRVFRGTRVAVKTLFAYLENNDNPQEVLDVLSEDQPAQRYD